jgi:hypothetical protein
MYYDILGVSAYGNVDPEDTADLTHLEIFGEDVGQLLTKRMEFPYDWDSGKIIYVVFLSAVFMGTIILEG